MAEEEINNRRVLNYSLQQAPVMFSVLSFITLVILGIDFKKVLPQ